MDPQPTLTAKILPQFKYYILFVVVDAFGQILFEGNVTMFFPARRPTSETEIAVMDVQTAKTIRAACDKDPLCPEGRVVITAAVEV
jgi:hypothetical protein